MSRKIFVIFVKNPLSFSLVANRIQTDREDDFNSRSAGMQQRLKIDFFLLCSAQNKMELKSSSNRNSLWKNQ